MKHIHTILAMAAIGASAISCSRALTPAEEPQDLRSEITKLNGNVAVIQALGQGEVINSVSSCGSSYDILLCNGRELTLSDRILANAPAVALENGVWTVAGETLMSEGSEAVSVELLPEFSLNASGEWTVSADGVETVLTKAVTTDGETPYFEALNVSETEFSLTPRNAPALTGAVAAGFLFKIDATGAQEFILGQTRTYQITKSGISAATVVAPEGWKAELSDTQISITSPSTASVKSVIANSATDVSVIAVSTSGYVTIAKVETSLDETASASDPFATLTLGTVGAFSAQVTVALQNQTAWYYLLKKSAETAPSAAEIKAATAGSSMTVSLTTEPETGYTLYVLPVSEEKDGNIAKISFTTAAVTSYYEAWEAGAEIKIGSQTFSKAKNGNGNLVKSTGQTIWNAWINNGTYGAIFLAEGASAQITGAAYEKSLIVIGDVPGTRPTVSITAGNTLTNAASNAVFSNVTFDMSTGLAADAFIYNNVEIGRLIFEDCRVNLTRPLLKRNGDGGKMAGIEIIDCDVCVNWASACSTYQLIHTHVGGADLGDLTVENNVFWSASDKREFHLCASPWGENYTALNDVVLRNNTFYNLNNGLLSNGRYKAQIMASTVNSFTTGANIAYDTAPENKSTSATPHFTWLKANSMTLEALKNVTTVSEKSLINIAEYCGLWGSDEADFGYGLQSLITWESGGWTTIASWIDPFESENAELGYFKTKEQYSAWGAQRK